jgi:hypothetical protein
MSNTFDAQMARIRGGVMEMAANLSRWIEKLEAVNAWRLSDAMR